MASPEKIFSLFDGEKFLKRRRVYAVVPCLTESMGVCASRLILRSWFLIFCFISQKHQITVYVDRRT